MRLEALGQFLNGDTFPGNLVDLVEQGVSPRSVLGVEEVVHVLGLWQRGRNKKIGLACNMMSGWNGMAYSVDALELWIYMVSKMKHM